MSESGENNVLEYLESLPEREFPDVFISKLIPVLEHAKEDIIEFLLSKPQGILKSLRNLVFEELVAKLPDYAERELYVRRKSETLAEDIFIFAFSAVNAIPDQRLTKCLKPTLQVDVSTDDISTDSSSHDTQALLDLCLALQQRVKSLETLVKTQNVRISDLETTLTNNLIQKIQNEQDNEDTAAVKSNNKSSVNSQINMKETPGETKVDSASDEQKSPSTSDSKASSTEAAKCTKETSGVRAASQNNSPVQEHTEATGRGDLLQIYIGKFAPNTTKEHIKDHLVKSSVAGVTDVKCLTSEDSDKSFCVTLNSSGAQKLIFGTNM